MLEVVGGMEGHAMSFMHPVPGDIATARISGTYMCLPCDVQFEYEAQQTDCPSCHSVAREDITALYVEHDAEEAEFKQAYDFGEGD